MAELTDDEVFGGAPSGDLKGYASAVAARHGVSPGLMLRVMHQESRGNPRAVSSKGARGPMQLMPGTASELGVDADNPYQNIEGGARYLKQQLDAFGGDERLALAAYNAGPGAVRKHGGVPPYAETQDYVLKIQGSAQPAAELSDAEVFGTEGLQMVDQSKDGSVTAYLDPQPAKTSAAPPPAPKADDGLGFIKGAFKPIDNAATALESVIRGTGAEAPLAAAGRGVRGMLPPGLVQFIDNPAGYYAAQAKERGVRPGKLGEFAGNIAGTLPLGALKGGSLIQGAASGAALTDAKDLGGVMRDMAVGGIGGRLADGAVQAVGAVAKPLLGKAAKVMALPELEAAKKAAYKAVDDSGFRFSKADGQALASDLMALVQKKGGKTLYGDAYNWAQRIKTLANQKGGLPLSQLDDARGEIYNQLVKAGSKESTLGTAMRAKIDGLISKEAAQNEMLRAARELNARWSKANVVARRLESADLARGRAYTGKNTDNTIRQKLSPLIDPMSNARLRNATPDEAKALKRAVTGSPGQNLTRLAGTMLDPRGVIGMGLQATGAAKTAGLSLASVPLGMISTAASGRMAQKNVQELLKLIAVGGSKAALKKAPTKASTAVQAAAKRARPVAGLIGGAAAATSGDR